MEYKLFGDGIHDDTAAIQEMLDGCCEVRLPVPEVCYIISRPLVLKSNRKLVLPRYAEIKLADGSNCVMLKNETEDGYAERITSKLFSFVNYYSPDHPCMNIEVEGGIWNLNNLGQEGNPMWTGSGPDGYTGVGMLIVNAKNFRLHDMTLKDPVNFAVTLDYASWFTVENITFDFKYGNPTAVNMDGIHLDGNCHYGTIRNLKGTCYDDLVALNADEGTDGPITNIEINGIYSTDCHSAVRLLTNKNAVENIHISNVFGTYYQYCIGLTNSGIEGCKGYYDAITLDNIYASKAERYDVYCKTGQAHYSLLYIQEYADVKNLKISTVHRREYNNPIFTLALIGGSKVDSMILENITVENHTDGKMIFMSNEGNIKNLKMRDIKTGGEALMCGSGTVGMII